MKLDSAKLLLESAISKEPDNGAYLDSYGWILFKWEIPEKAFEYIGKALARIPNDPKVFEHLGDIRPGGVIQRRSRAYGKCLEYHSEDQDRIRGKILRLEAIIHGKVLR